MLKADAVDFTAGKFLRIVWPHSRRDRLHDQFTRGNGPQLQAVGMFHLPLGLTPYGGIACGVASRAADCIDIAGASE